MVWAALAPLLPALIGAGGAITSSVISSKGNKSKLRQRTTQTSGQSQLSDFLTDQSQQSAGSAFDLLRQYMDPSSEATSAFAEPYIRQFNEETIPQLAERFAGLGPESGALTSSGFGQALGAAGGKLQTDLASLKGGLGQKSLSDLFSLMQGLTNEKRFGYSQQPAQTGFGESLFGNLLQGLGQSGSNPLSSLFDLFSGKGKFPSQVGSMARPPAPAPISPGGSVGVPWNPSQTMRGY